MMCTQSFLYGYDTYNFLSRAGKSQRECVCVSSQRFRSMSTCIRALCCSGTSGSDTPAHQLTCTINLAPFLKVQLNIAGGEWSDTICTILILLANNNSNKKLVGKTRNEVDQWPMIMIRYSTRSVLVQLEIPYKCYFMQLPCKLTFRFPNLIN